MDAGLITKENFPNILRSISQRRRQGSLEIRSGELETKIQFIQGKIVEVIRGGASPQSEVVESLKAADLIPAQVVFYQENYHDLWDALQQACPHPELSESLFRRSIQQRILDRVYGIELPKGAYFTFRVEMVNTERDLYPSISVGQVLLDLVDYEAVHGRFLDTVGPGQVVEKAAALTPEGASVEELSVLRALSREMTVGELRKRSLLSRFHFEAAFLSLMERGALLVESLSKEVAEQPVVGADDLLSALDGAIDRAYQDELKSLEDDSLFEFMPEGRPGEEPPPSPESESSDDGPGRTAAPGMVERTRQQLSAVNADLVQRSWAAEAGTILFLMAALLLPFFSWRAVVQWFLR